MSLPSDLQASPQMSAHLRATRSRSMDGVGGFADGSGAAGPRAQFRSATLSGSPSRPLPVRLEAGSSLLHSPLTQRGGGGGGGGGDRLPPPSSPIFGSVPNSRVHFGSASLHSFSPEPAYDEDEYSENGSDYSLNAHSNDRRRVYQGSHLVYGGARAFRDSGSEYSGSADSSEFYASSSRNLFAPSTKTNKYVTGLVGKLFGSLPSSNSASKMSRRKECGKFIQTVSSALGSAISAPVKIILVAGYNIVGLFCSQEQNRHGGNISMGTRISNTYTASKNVTGFNTIERIVAGVISGSTSLGLNIILGLACLSKFILWDLLAVKGGGAVKLVAMSAAAGVAVGAELAWRGSCAACSYTARKCSEFGRYVSSGYHRAMNWAENGLQHRCDEFQVWKANKGAEVDSWIAKKASVVVASHTGGQVDAIQGILVAGALRKELTAATTEAENAGVSNSRSVAASLAKIAQLESNIEGPASPKKVLSLNEAVAQHAVIVTCAELKNRLREACGKFAANENVKGHYDAGIQILDQHKEQQLGEIEANASEEAASLSSVGSAKSDASGPANLDAFAAQLASIVAQVQTLTVDSETNSRTAFLEAVGSHVDQINSGLPGDSELSVFDDDNNKTIAELKTQLASDLTTWESSNQRLVPTQESNEIKHAAFKALKTLSTTKDVKARSFEKTTKAVVSVANAFEKKRQKTEATRANLEARQLKSAAAQSNKMTEAACVTALHGKLTAIFAANGDLNRDTINHTEYASFQVSALTSTMPLADYQKELLSKSNIWLDANKPEDASAEQINAAASTNGGGKTQKVPTRAYKAVEELRDLAKMSYSTRISKSLPQKFAELSAQKSELLARVHTETDGIGELSDDEDENDFVRGQGSRSHSSLSSSTPSAGSRDDTTALIFLQAPKVLD